MDNEPLISDAQFLAAGFSPANLKPMKSLDVAEMGDEEYREYIERRKMKESWREMFLRLLGNTPGARMYRAYAGASGYGQDGHFDHEVAHPGEIFPHHIAHEKKGGNFYERYEKYVYFAATPQQVDEMRIPAEMWK